MSNLMLARIALVVGALNIASVACRFATEGRINMDLSNTLALLLGAGGILCYYLKPSE